jgi:D-3-phosphoglycerate dehydrogenase
LRLLIAEAYLFPKEAKARLERRFQLHTAKNAADFRRSVGHCDILSVRLINSIDQELMYRSPHLRCIVSPTIGLSHIDLTEAHRRGIWVLSLQGEAKYLDSITATAERSIGFMLALIRRLPPAVNSALSGVWNQVHCIGPETSGLTLGIVGLGRVGRHVAERAKPLFKGVLAYDQKGAATSRHASPAGLDRLLDMSDVVSIDISESPKKQDIFRLSAVGDDEAGRFPDQHLERKRPRRTHAPQGFEVSANRRRCP